MLATPKIDVSGLRITFDFNHPQWPKEPYIKPRVDGNLWIGFKIMGKWHMTTMEWCPIDRPQGFVCKLEAKKNQPPIIQGNGPISKHYPISGDECVFMISSMCRGGIRNPPRGRSRIVKTIWK
jgi:hypothetical protein